MSLKLIEALETAINARVQDQTKNVGDEASVLVQFAAGDWAKIRGALATARADYDAVTKHNIADAAGVASHSASGQPFPVDTRLDMAASALPDEDTLPPVAAVPQEEAPVPSTAVSETPPAGGDHVA